MDSLNLRTPYSPSNSLFAPELLLVDLLPEPTEIPDLEYVPYLPIDVHDAVSIVSDGLGFDVPSSSTGVYGDEAEERGSVITLNSPGISDRPVFLASNGHIRLSYFESSSSVGGFDPFIPLSDLVLHGTGSAAQEPGDLIEYRIQRLIEVYESQRSRISRPNGDAASDASLASPDRLMHNIVQSGISLATAKKDGSKKHEENGENYALNFECNICLELARDPVVTPCGHLFCWPCLYQWLFAHSRYSECPVCKGEVLEVNVTPIYGHGGKDSSAGKQSVEGRSNEKIPPRPHASRVENLREQFLRQRGSNANQRPFSDHVLTFRAAVLSSLMARIPPNREASQSNPTGVALHGNMTSVPHHDPPGIQERLGQPLPSVETSFPDIRRTASLSASEQTSNSSTMAVIQDDRVTTENASRLGRWPITTRRSRRVRSSSGSQDIDESEQERSRRRLN